MGLAMKMGVNPTAGILGVKHDFVTARLRAVEKHVGFELTSSGSYAPSMKGRAWGERAYRIYNKKQELLIIARPMVNRKSRQHDILLDDVLDWNQKPTPISNYIGVTLKNRLGFMVMNGMVLSPTINELCELIRNLRALESVLCETKHSSEFQAT